MIKNVFLLATVIVFMSCGGGVEQPAEPQPKAKSMVEDANASHPDYIKGADLVEKYQCMACHKKDEKLTGPSYKEVAAKYAGADDKKVNELAKKIVAGGSGAWGEIPMTPHPNVSDEDAKAMVKYILLLNK